MENSINNRTSRVNKLQGKYLSSTLNPVWTIDVTTIKQKYYFFFIIDLVSRRIVYHSVSQRDFTTSEAVYILERTLKLEASVYPLKPVIFAHTDSGTIFASKEWYEWLERNGLQPSSSNSGLYQNQVSERFNRTFKRLLRDK